MRRGKKVPRTLLNDCGYELWRRRYVDRSIQSSSRYPWSHTSIIDDRPLSSCTESRSRHASRWTIWFHFASCTGVLFGCTEDISCSASDGRHADDYESAPYCRKLCHDCEVPVCDDCWLKLQDHDAKSKFHDGGSIPMSVSNDHYYGHVHEYLEKNKVTWLECAACCTVWSTMLAYYLEAPYGHLMQETMGNPEGRTRVKGNLFRFSMPWEDIEECCRRASD